jgi:hypothetical protein
MYRLFHSRDEPELDDVVVNGDLEDLRPQVVQIFALVGEAIAGATHALLAGDRELAKPSTRPRPSCWRTRRSRQRIDVNS